MSAPSQEVFPLFKSNEATRAAALLYNSGQEYSYSELARMLDVTPQALSKTLPDLVRGRILVQRIHGKMKMVKANTEAPFYAPLLQIFMMSMGPVSVLAEEFSSVGGIRELYIFGSWAERAAGVSGWAPNDIDVLVIGEPSSVQVALACNRAGERLKQPVNPTIASTTEWDEGTPFLDLVKKKPLSAIPHTPSAVEEEAEEDTSDEWWKSMLTDAAPQES